MNHNKKLLLALLAGVTLVAESAFAQQPPAPSAAAAAAQQKLPLRQPSNWMADKHAGAAPQQVADPLGIVVVDGARYGLAESALKNLDATRVLIAAADALGMVRNNDYENPRYNTVGGSTHAWEYRATGTLGGQKASVIVGFDYRGPSVRAQSERGTAKEILVATGDKAWDESKPGIYSGAAKTSAADRLLQLYLLPPAVIFEGVANVDKIKVTAKAGQKELTIPVSRYSTEMKATVNDKDQIVHLEMTVGGKLHSADFSEYANDKMDYHVFFPHKIVQKVDGQVVADLTVTEHWTGPYMVWPLPKEIAAK